jgi:hypothetical protein
MIRFGEAVPSGDGAVGDAFRLVDELAGRRELA